MELADIFLKLQATGCHNLNLVTPTHFLHPIIDALSMAREKGFKLPVVYNTSGYERTETLDILDGIVDIYLADIRYAADDAARKFSCAPGYALIARNAVKAMHEQAGGLVIEDGIAKKGLIIRLLILPNGLSGLEETFEFLSKKVSKDVFISLMSQYLPAYKAPGIKEISRRITKKEYDTAVELLHEYGFSNGWVQGFVSDDSLAGTNLKPI